MIFSLLAQGAPGLHQGAGTAFRFASALLAAGHSLKRVFFYAEGAVIGNTLQSLPQDEADIPACWLKLRETHDLELAVCVGSAARRGILDPGTAERLSGGAGNFREGFLVSGLGQLMDAALRSDRLIVFGP